MTPADPPLPKSSPAPDRCAARPSGRRAARSRWTAPAAAQRFALAYKYRFVEGLAATRVRCPVPGVRPRAREYYLPVNAFDVAVAPAPRHHARRPLTVR